jgi:fatty-acyl-CoA synthase
LWAVQIPNKPALLFEQRSITYEALALAIELRTRQLLAIGIGRGDRVAFLGYNNPEMLYLLYACSRLGAILVPLNWRQTTAEHMLVLQDCAASLLVAERGFETNRKVLRENGADIRFVVAEELSGLTHTEDDISRHLVGDDDDPVLLVYTSGTTGAPKGVLLTQLALLWNAVNSQQAHGLRLTDQVLTDLPMFNVYGLNIQTLPALHNGATVILHRRFDPLAALQSIHNEHPDIYLMEPATMRALIDHPQWPATDLSSLRVVMASSSTIPVRLLQIFLDRGIAIGQIYGSTETAPIATVLSIEHAARKMGACGKAAPHCKVRIVNDNGTVLGAGVPGEIQVSGPNLMREYWGRPRATSDAFDGEWFRTGDIAHWDHEGFLYIDGRKTRVIDSPG